MTPALKKRVHSLLNAGLFALACLILLVATLRFSLADPSGGQISFNSTSGVTIPNPGNRSDAGGTVNYINMGATQQDSAWKAYVGNVSGLLTLDDVNANTIYDWTLSSIVGRVFASRNNSITWSVINCSNQTVVDSDQAAVSFASSDSDSVNRTFSNTNHKSFLVASRNMSGCRSTALWINDTVQAIGPSSLFQEILLSDGTNMVYTTIIEPTNPQGFDGKTRNFQLIVPQSKTTQTPTLYYFYVELG